MRSKQGYYDVFVRTCAKFPSRVAVSLYKNGGYSNYTYSELYGVCEYISQNLQQLKCNKGIIGLVSDRNIIIPCVIAAAHKCCTTFMFIDPSQDIETLGNEITFTIIIIIKNKDNTDSHEMFKKNPDKSVAVFDLIINFYNCNPQYDQENRYSNQHSFIAMTSGSTGEPKHIQVPIQCIQPNIDDLTKMFQIIPEDIIYFSTPLTFDPSMIEILLACLNGASLLIAPEDIDILFPENKKNSITFWQTTPSKFFQYTNVDIKDKILSADSTLKVLALGGEPLNGVKILKKLKDQKNKTRIFTLYGVTEMSCWACIAELDLNKVIRDKEIPLGNCLSETKIIVEPTKNKNSGKIMLVSKTRNCYILSEPKGHQEQNSLKFVDTGDLGEIRNGNIYYRGRIDDIIKRFGNKVNLQQIETTIMQCPRVKTCSCVWLPKPMLLIVYFSSENLSSQELSDFLKCKLDDKHWPDKVVRVDNLPTNAHGKISKHLISKMFENNVGFQQTVRNLKLEFLRELELATSRNFTYDEIKNQSFFSLGGTSFLAVSMCNKISLTNPQFGKFIQPYLMSTRHNIGDIIEMAQKENCLEGVPSLFKANTKKHMKRNMSDAGCEGNESSSSVKKSNLMENCNQGYFSVVWAYDTGKCVDASPTLFRTEYNIFVTVGSHSGKVIVMDALNGSLQGSITMSSRVEASVFCHQASALPPCGIVGTHDGSVICFELENCKQMWRSNIGAMVKSKAVCCNGTVYIAAYDGKLWCINIMTGAIKQTIPIAEIGISADLVLAKNEFILVGSLSGMCASIHTVTNSIVWQVQLNSPVFASPVLYNDDKLVMFVEVTGMIHCRTVEKGIKVWKYQSTKGNIFSSIYVKKVDKLKWQMVYGSFDNKVCSISIRNFQPSLHWEVQLTSPVFSTPCGLRERYILAASTNGVLCVIDADNGNILTKYQLSNETFSSPATHGDYIFIGSRDDHLHSLQFTLNV